MNKQIIEVMDNSYIITVYPDYINFQNKETGVNYRLYKDCSFGIQKNIPEELLEVAEFIKTSPSQGDNN